MPTSTQIANWAFEEADETMVNNSSFICKKSTQCIKLQFIRDSNIYRMIYLPCQVEEEEDLEEAITDSEVNNKESMDVRQFFKQVVLKSQE